MIINSVSFGASIDNHTFREAYEIAQRKGMPSIMEFNAKVAQVKKWGSSLINITNDPVRLAKLGKSADSTSELMAYKCNHLVGIRGTELVNKGNVYDSFMALREEDIVKAEKLLDFKG